MVSLPSVATVTMYFFVPSMVPTVPSANAASYSPASVPFAPTVIAEKSAPSGAPVKSETLCSSPLYVSVLLFAVSSTFL